MVRFTSPVVILALFGAACGGGNTGTEPLDHAALHGASPARASTGNAVAAAGLGKVVYAASARFHSRVQASRAGYLEAHQCVAVPGLGGMGYHWANPGLVDAVFNPLEPEVMLYATGENGKLQLVAVEYVVVNVGQAAPSFAGQPFAVGGAPIPVAHWTLHVWLHRDNPSGLFAPFNPDVTCP